MALITDLNADGAAGVIANPSPADEIVGRIERLPFTPLHVRIATLIGLGSFADTFDGVILSVAMTVIVTALHFGYVNVGLISSAAYLGMAIGCIASGWLSEIVGRKPVLVWTIGIFGAMSLAAAFAWDFKSLLIIRLIQGLALGGNIPVGAALYNEFLSGKARGKRFFIGYSALFVLGTLMGPLAGLATFGLFGPAVGWRALFVLGALAIPLAIAVQMLLPESPRWLAEKGRIAEAAAVAAQLEASALASGKTLPPLTLRLRADQQATRFGELFQGIYARRTILIWTAFFTTYFVNSGVQSWLPTLYVKFGGLPPKDALVLALTHGVIGFIAIIVFGLYADRIGRKNGFILGYSLSIVGLLVGIAALTLFKVKVWPVLFLIGVVTAGGVQLNAAACYIWPPELFPTRMRSWATSTGGASNRIASFIAPTAIGAILGANIGIISVFALLCAVCVIGLIVVMTLGIETRDRALEELSS